MQVYSLRRNLDRHLYSAVTSFGQRATMASTMIETSGNIAHAAVYGVGAWTAGNFLAFVALHGEPNPDLRMWLGFLATCVGASVPLYATWAKRQREKEEARLRAETSQVEYLRHQLMARDAVIAALKVEIEATSPPSKLVS